MCWWMKWTPPGPTRTTYFMSKQLLFPSWKWLNMFLNLQTNSQVKNIYLKIISRSPDCLYKHIINNCWPWMYDKTWIRHHCSVLLLILPSGHSQYCSQKNQTKVSCEFDFDPWRLNIWHCHAVPALLRQVFTYQPSTKAVGQLYRQPSNERCADTDLNCDGGQNMLTSAAYT